MEIKFNEAPIDAVFDFIDPYLKSCYKCQTNSYYIKKTLDTVICKECKFKYTSISKTFMVRVINTIKL